MQACTQYRDPFHRKGVRNRLQWEDSANQEWGKTRQTRWAANFYIQIAALILLSFYFTLLVLFPFLGFLLQPFHSKSHSVPGCDSLVSYNKPQPSEQGPPISVLPYRVPMWIHNTPLETPSPTMWNALIATESKQLWGDSFSSYTRKKKR